MNNLEASVIEEGLRKCCDQAAQLIKDAELLYENKRFTTAFSLYQLASEESSKIKILLRLAIEKRSNVILMDADRGKYFRKLFYNHAEKIKLGTITDKNFNELAERLNLPKFREESEIEHELNNPREIDLLKQDGIYVSLKNGQFVSPFEIITATECLELRNIVVFRHNRQKETMQDYLQYTDFYVERFIEDMKIEQKKKQDNTL